ncbi:tyrosine-type recombinase/integrase [Pseudoflavonifractor phocaeensis]|uniref:tyrosine-type recombinase/integrase n=1 Tax=Pseudoflavonifractor phocaeensis TaxID=1870988 RepID=UPI001F42D56F|nr:tyrosine-type recombinase/integrase [Pseudoflavonifractor phocaeensis]
MGSQASRGAGPIHSIICQETGQRFLGVHHFRHLNASLLINSGADVRTVSASLGHSQVTTTLNIYAHTFAEAQARAGEAVAEALALGSTKKASGSA